MLYHVLVPGIMYIIIQRVMFFVFAVFAVYDMIRDQSSKKILLG